MTATATIATTNPAKVAGGRRGIERGSRPGSAGGMGGVSGRRGFDAAERGFWVCGRPTPPDGDELTLATAGPRTDQRPPKSSLFIATGASAGDVDDPVTLTNGRGILTKCRTNTWWPR